MGGGRLSMRVECNSEAGVQVMQVCVCGQGRGWLPMRTEFNDEA